MQLLALIFLPAFFKRDKRKSAIIQLYNLNLVGIWRFVSHCVLIFPAPRGVGHGVGFLPKRVRNVFSVVGGVEERKIYGIGGVKEYVDFFTRQI